MSQQANSLSVQAWEPESHSWNPHKGGKRKLTPQLFSDFVAHMQMDSHAYIHNNNKMKSFSQEKIVSHICKSHFPLFDLHKFLHGSPEVIL